MSHIHFLIYHDFSVNGVPSCVNKRAMTDVLRKKFGFRGFVISDEGAIQVIVTYHKYLNNTVDTAAAAVNAGEAHQLLTHPFV